ncbi:MAG: hypothetical protein ICV59_03935 [Thermoleophilia bacterium]|nr:hypothetical protein [Thermoleophilia bacterium]
MSETVEPTPASGAAIAYPRAWSLERHELVLFAAATAVAWAHTIDEIRIGELIAVPFGIANVALLASWSRMRAGRRALTSILFGLFWGLAVIPYHVLPLLEGAVTGQNVSGLSRLVGGAAMVALGVAILRRRDGGAADEPATR